MKIAVSRIQFLNLFLSPLFSFQGDTRKFSVTVTRSRVAALIMVGLNVGGGMKQIAII